jgi:hypothetical protein
MKCNAGIIRYMLEKFKYLVRTDAVFYAIVIVLVGIISFWLGRASVIVSTPETKAPAVKITPAQAQSAAVLQASTTTVTPTPISTGSQAVVASKSGTKYHLVNCPGASQIKPENLITFASIAAAEAAGYTPAANCPGLK